MNSIRNFVSKTTAVISLNQISGSLGSANKMTNLSESIRMKNPTMSNSTSLAGSDENISGHLRIDIGERRESQQSMGYLKPKISSWDAGWNVTNSIQGMFVLGLPYAIMHGGYLGLLLIVLTAVICYYTGLILVECLYESDGDGQLIRVRESYFDVATACWGRRVGGTLVNAAQLIELLMTCVLYIVVSGNLLASSFPSALIGEAGWSTIATVALVPCIFLKNLRAVSKLSMGCTIAQIIVVIITLIYCLANIQTWAWREISLTVNTRFFPVSIGVIVFSYTSQIFLPSLEGSMEYKDSFKKMLAWSYGTSCGSKFVFALFCFLTWSHDTKEVITDNLPHGLRIVVSLVLAVKALLSYPLPYYASVEVFEQTMFTGVTGGLGSLFKTKAHPYEDLSRSQSSEFSGEESSINASNSKIITEATMLKSVKDESENVSAGFPSCYTPNGKVQLWAYGLRLLLVIGTYIIALIIPHFALLMGLTGSLTGASLAFVFPSAFYLQLRWKTLSTKQIILNFTIVSVGLISGVSGIYHSIIGLYEAYHPPTNDFMEANFRNSTLLNPFTNDTSAEYLTSTASPMRDLIIFNEPGPVV